jgi:hypothetical protein
MIDRDTELGPFGRLYEEWVGVYPDPRDPALEARLAASYREAWRDNIGIDRYSILSFIFDRKDQDGADLIMEGLASNDARIVQQAAVFTSVGRGLGYFDFGPGARAAYRAMVRRFPDNDACRPHAFYGHQPGDVDDTEGRPFVNLFEDWMADEYPRDATVGRALADSCHTTWAEGDAVDKAFVLRFIGLNTPRNRHAIPVGGADLVTEALKTDDPRLARTAAFEAWSLLEEGIGLGPDTRAALKSLGKRFPDCATCVWSALRALDKLEGNAS